MNKYENNEIYTDYLIHPGNSSLVKRKSDIAVPTDLNVKLRENEMPNNYLNLAKIRKKKNVKNDCDSAREGSKRPHVVCDTRQMISFCN